MAKPTQNPINKYKAFGLHNFENIDQVRNHLSPLEKKSIRVIGNVLPFKVNNYVVDELIDWSNVPDDPIFQLTFPQEGMLSGDQFHKMENAMDSGINKTGIKEVSNSIRYELNPNPSGQIKNIPKLDGTKLTGVQHKYKETVLFFPSNGQTCHAYCTFCFRWPQFVGMDELKFAMKETELLKKYLAINPEITDVIFTGGDPMIMSAKKFGSYIDALIENDESNLQNIRIGTKALTYWPYKFLTDKDSDDMLRLFERITRKGYHLAFMAHFNHPRELQTDAVKAAIKRIKETGAEIRTQAPVMKHINDDAESWKEMWKTQVKLGCIPYYMFVARDTGAHNYFAVELDRTLDIFTEAYAQISGIARTVRGPSMSANPGKVQVMGVEEIMGRKVFVLRFIQARDPEWVNRIFFAKYNPDCMWLDELEPAFGEEKFFFEEDLTGMYTHPTIARPSALSRDPIWFLSL
jgi:L-lysine 2,3-aminomutase